MAGAKGRLELTRGAYRNLRACGDDSDAFQMHWDNYLVQLKGTITRIEQAAKDTPKEIQWFCGVKKTRRDDPLLRYLFEARNDSEHRAAKSARHSPKLRPLTVDRNVTKAQISFDLTGKVTKITDQDGNEVSFTQGKILPAESILVEVTERDGVRKVPPPTSHLGSPMEPKPLIAAEFGLLWLETLVSTAVAMSKP